MSTARAATRETQHLLVCVVADDRMPEVVEQGRRLHAAQGGSWSVVAIETPAVASREAPASVHVALEAARSGGASILRLGSAGDGHHDVVAAIVQRARTERATALLVGMPRLDMAIWRSEGEALSRLVDELAQQLPELRLHVLAPPRGQGAAPALAAAAARPRSWLRGWPHILAMLSIATLVAMLIEPWFDPANLITIYLTGVVWVALRHGGPAALTATVGSIALFDLALVPPRWALRPIDPQYYFTFGVMLFVGLVISELAARLQRQAAMAEARAQRSHALNRFAVDLVQARSAEAIGAALVAAAGEAVHRPVWLCPAPDGALPAAAVWPPEARLHRPAVEAAWASRAEAGRGTAVAASCAVRCVPLVAGDHVTGVLGIPMEADGPPISSEDTQLLSALAHQAAVALERALLDTRAARAAWEVETERLRNTLLAGLSHDFRTPLTAIIGSVGSLLEHGDAIEPLQRRALLESVRDQAERMSRLSDNLLQLTRLQEGVVKLRAEWSPADELLAEVLAGLGQRAADVRSQVSADAMLWCDPSLLGQVLHNLIDNALRHAGEGAGIQVSLSLQPGEVRLVVQDDGPGMPAEIIERGPTRFVRGHDGGGSGAGSGLGLALCAAIVQLHRGELRLGHAGGARCEIVLPQPAARAIA